MPIIGGAGNVAGGANPSGTGGSINYVGNHAYATNKVTDAGSGAASSTVFDFTTGNSYIISTVSWGTDATGGQNNFVNIQINSEDVFDIVYDSGQIHTIADQPLKILIPPNSRFTFKWGIASVTKAMSVVLVGRVYA